MCAAHALDFADLFDEIDTQIHPFLFLVFGAGQTFDQLIGNVHPRHVFADPLSRFR